jgi:hypothetical protein
MRVVQSRHSSSKYFDRSRLEHEHRFICDLHAYAQEIVHIDFMIINRHNHKHEYDHSFLPSAEIDTLNVKQVMCNTYECALDTVRSSDILDGLSQPSIIILKDLSELILEDPSWNSILLDRVVKSQE